MSKPLWKLMEAAFLEGRKPGHCDRLGYAAEMRAVAEWLERFIAEMPYHSERQGLELVSAMLRAEAGLTEHDQ